MPAKSKKNAEPADENALISPKNHDLPDLPSMKEGGAHNLSKDKPQDASQQMKKFVSLTVVGLVAIGIGTYIGTTYFSNDNHDYSISLSREVGQISNYSGFVEVSPDSGISWQKLEKVYDIHPGMQLRTAAGGTATLNVGTSSFSIGERTEVLVNSLNNIKVSVELIEGSIETSVADSEGWTFEITSENASYTSKGATSASVIGNTLVVAVGETGTARSGGMEYTASEQIIIDR